MRELTLEEQELIAGGTVTTDIGPDIVVTADPGDGGGDWGGDWGYWPGDGGDYGGGDGGGGGGDGGGDSGPTMEPEPDGTTSRGANHVDMSRLSPSPSIDLSDCAVVVMTIGGHDIKVVFDNKTMPVGSAERNAATLGFNELAANFGKLDAAAQERISHLDHVVFTNVPDSSTVTGRSFSTEANGSFFYDSSELGAATQAFIASNILHDANHIAIFDRTGDLNQSRGRAAEVEGWQLQVNNAAALGLQQYEVDYLNALIADPNSGGGRVDQPAYPG
jgi:hypothetical protein